ncbi:uncharacterized protein Dana_GF26882 [Drosophila ananassae]|uniref:Uncharacterized protein n=1 Tax=Drosophila ananassae TaxID=7217 RepID=A0A0P8XFE0_DROAN|nr:uncharacterized protein Dana_GF26882 [Drosophila ananassae]
MRSNIWQKRLINTDYRATISTNFLDGKPSAQTTCNNYYILYLSVLKDICPKMPMNWT